MTDDPHAPELSPELLDEICSADLDGELEAACADLGLTLDDARAAVAAHHDRRAALAAAGARVGVRTADDELGELERRRMSRDAAARASRSSVQSRRRLVLVGAAAAVAAVVGVSVAVTRGGNGTPTAHGGSQPLSGPVFDVGSVKNGDEYGAKLGFVHGSTASTGAKPVTTTAPFNASTPTTTLEDAANATRCLSSLSRKLGATDMRIVAVARMNGKRVLAARGTIGGVPALLGFEPEGCHTAFSLAGRRP